MSSEAHRAIEAVWRIEAPRLIAGLVRRVRDLGLAEDLAQDALVAALEQWPTEGVPRNPGAWLMTAAQRRAIDYLRARERHERKHEELGRELDERVAEDGASEADEPRDDDLLRLIFLTCHPVLSVEARVALTLRLLGGLTTEEIARAYLVPEATVAQRIVRAKRTLAEARVPFETPVGAELGERLEAVLRVLYLIFNEGYSPAAGNAWTRPELVDEAIRLGRVLAELAPREAEVHGLIALMELQASRLRARVASDGTPILLLDQDRSRWDALLIRRGLAALERAASLAAATGGSLGPYALQAAIAACHARARTGAETDWTRIAAIYDALVELVPTPVVALNRAVAVSMAFGPAEALPLLDELRDEPSLARYHPLPAARGDILAKLGRRAEARAEFERAADLAGNARDAALLRARAREMAEP